MDTDGGHLIMNTSDERINPDRAFVIGNRVWLSSGTKVLKGSYIVDGCILAANSVVTRKLEITNAIYLGNKLLKSDIHWKK